MSDQRSGQAHGEQDTRPVPDPTLLTTRALDQAISNLGRLLQAEVVALHDLLKAEGKSQGNVMHERFRKIEQQFEAVERHRVEQKADTIDAALTAQKEAVTKTEASTTKQLEQLSANFATAISAVDGGLGDIKERVSRIESAKLGGQELLQERRSNNSAMYALAGFILVVINIVGLVVAMQAGR